ncbi:MAG: hypothetical protein ACFFB8_18720 [Promethearchaeota archaeon]
MSVLGELFYRIVFNDSRGNAVFFDTVFINNSEREVLDGQDWGPVIIIASVTGGGIVVAVSIVVVKKRKH